MFQNTVFTQSIIAYLFIQKLDVVDIKPCFFIFIKVHNFYELCLASYDNVDLPKWDLFLKERVCFKERFSVKVWQACSYRNLYPIHHLGLINDLFGPVLIY